MWRKYSTSIVKRFDLIVLLTVFFLIASANFEPGMWLSGWDNLHPEFNPWTNITRTLSGVWQEHQNLGHVGGHGYAATLIHSLMIVFLQYFLPADAPRMVFMLLSLLAGGLGARSLVLYLLHTQPEWIKRTAATFAGLWYMLNLGTIQNFYIPLEAFTIHFALLPWQILTLIRYLNQPAKKTFLYLLIANIFAIPAGFIPPLFVVTVISYGVLIAYKLFQHPHIHYAKTAGSAAAAIICVHAFWFIPVLNYSLSPSQQEYLNSYANLTTTGDFISQNKAFGDLAHVAILKGFYFNAQDSEQLGVTFKIFSPWEDHLNKPFVIIIGYVLFGFTVLGTILAFLRPTKLHWSTPVALLGLLSFTALATDIPFFSSVSSFLQNTIPVFRQAFRIAFTKFSVSASLWYSALAAYGLSHLLIHIQIFRYKKTIASVISTALLVAILWYSYPVFWGHLFYRRAKLDIPKSYFQLMDFFQNQAPGERIANFAQGWRTGWVIYNWGYSGSGFLWYGIPQPITDRSFDVWSKYNENYYWEISSALDANDFSHFDSIMDKYNIRWLILDYNTRPYTTGSEVSKLYNIDNHVQNTAQYSHVQTFKDNRIQPIHVYRYTPTNTVTPNIQLLQGMPNILPVYAYNDRDIAYLQHNEYVSDTEIPADYVYPFRSLFSSRSPSQNEIGIQDSENEITFSTEFSTKNDMNVMLPDFLSLESFVPAKIETISDSTSVTLVLKILYPQIQINSQPVSVQESQIQLFSIPQNLKGSDISVNGVRIPLESINSAFFQLYTKELNTISTSDTSGKYYSREITLTHENIFQTLPIFPVIKNQTNTLTVTIPKNSFASYNSLMQGDFKEYTSNRCDITVDTSENNRTWIQDKNPHWKFNATGGTSCLSLYLPDLNQASGYLVKTVSRNKNGRQLQLILENLTTNLTDLDLLLPNSMDWYTSYTIQQPERNDGIGYSVKLYNKSLNRFPTTNDVSEFSIWPIPYNWLKNISVTDISRSIVTASSSTEPLSVSHPNTSYYKIQILLSTDYQPPTTLLLSQSYHPGWNAYTTDDSWFQNTFPFLFAKKVDNHVLVNNWSNGWVFDQLSIDNSQLTIVLFFTPQLLQWIGFLLLPLPFVWLIVTRT